MLWDQNSAPHQMILRFIFQQITRRPGASVLTHQGKPECGACSVWGHAVSPRPCLLWVRGPRPASVGVSLPDRPQPGPASLPAAPGGRSSVPVWDLDCCSCPLTALLFSGHTASGWISHPTSDSEKGKRRLRWALTQLPADPAGLAWILSWLTLTVPLAKAPASSLSRSAPAASPGPESLSTALALRIGTEDHCFASVDSGGRKGHHGGHWEWTTWRVGRLWYGCPRGLS